MRRHGWIVSLVMSLVLGGLVTCLIFGKLRTREDPVPSEHPAAVQPRAEEVRSVGDAFERLYDALIQAGAKPVPGIAKRLEQAVKSGDRGEILRTFDEAIYDRYANLDQSIPALRAYLTHPDPFIRYLAGRTLYTAGDRSGFSTLLEMVRAPSPIAVPGAPIGGQAQEDWDLRIEAARLLGTFREKGAFAGIVALYRETKQALLLTLAVRLGGRGLPEDLVADLLAQKNTAWGLFNLRQVGFPALTAAARDAFDNPRVPAIYSEQVKTVAAWVLADTGEQGPYMDYLLREAAPAKAAEGDDTNSHVTALKYVGSIDSPRVQELLGQAAGSARNIVSAIAVVNLLFNQTNGAERAKEVLLSEIRGEQHTLGVSLTWNIAAVLHDPEVNAASEAYDRLTGEGEWRHYGIGRQNWPLYDWVDDYVVRLNGVDADRGE